MLFRHISKWKLKKLLSCRGSSFLFDACVKLFQKNNSDVMIPSVSLFLFTGGDLSRRWEGVCELSVRECEWECVYALERARAGQVWTSSQVRAPQWKPAGWWMENFGMDRSLDGWADEWKNEVLKPCWCTHCSVVFVYSSACTVFFYCVFIVILKDLWYNPSKTCHALK